MPLIPLEAVAEKDVRPAFVAEREHRTQAFRRNERKRSPFQATRSVVHSPRQRAAVERHQQTERGHDPERRLRKARLRRVKRARGGATDPAGSCVELEVASKGEEVVTAHRAPRSGLRARVVSC